MNILKTLGDIHTKSNKGNLRKKRSWNKNPKYNENKQGKNRKRNFLWSCNTVGNEQNSELI